MEWPRFEQAPFFRERDPEYRTVKSDPGTVFMEKLRAQLTDLNLADRWPTPGEPLRASDPPGPSHSIR